MGELHLPVQLGGNATWRWKSSDDLAVSCSTFTDGGEGVGVRSPAVGWFPEVPTGDMWAFERIAAVFDDTFSADAILVHVAVCDRQDDALALDLTSLVDGGVSSGVVDVYARAFPLQVLGGNRLAIAFTDLDGSNLLFGSARAQISRYERA